jgi:DNA ligase-1
MGYIVHKAIEFDKLSAAWKKKMGVTDIDNLGDKYALQNKYDGCYAVIKLRGMQHYEVLSRTGETVRSMDHIAQRLRSLFMPQLAKGANLAIHGEAWARGHAQQKASGWFRKHENVPQLQFAAFDAMFLESFEAGLSEVPFIERYSGLAQQVRGFTESDPVFLCPLYLPGTYGKPTDVAAKLQAEGSKRAFDGAILRNLDAGWKAGAGSDGAIIKVKPRPSFDLRIAGFEEGQGKYAGTVGKVSLQFADGRFVIAAGGTDAERADMWANPDKYIGKIGEVTCLERLASGELREPVFKGVRFDKVDID